MGDTNDKWLADDRRRSQNTSLHSLLCNRFEENLKIERWDLFTTQSEFLHREIEIVRFYSLLRFIRNSLANDDCPVSQFLRRAEQSVWTKTNYKTRNKLFYQHPSSTRFPVSSLRTVWLNGHSAEHFHPSSIPTFPWISLPLRHAIQWRLEFSDQLTTRPHKEERAKTGAS